MSEKPLHVQVAEALGWTKPKHHDGEHEREEFRDGYSKCYGCGQVKNWSEEFEGVCDPTPRYDTDWSVTGPLIEKYRIDLIAHMVTWTAIEGRRTGPLEVRQGDTPLEAVCRLIVALAAEGKLEAK